VGRGKRLVEKITDDDLGRAAANEIDKRVTDYESSLKAKTVPTS
jgi:hypothetical protein